MHVDEAFILTAENYRKWNPKRSDATGVENSRGIGIIHSGGVVEDSATAQLDVLLPLSITLTL